jgi:pimeloyl-ACP methyl ester carboxylesterase
MATFVLVHGGFAGGWCWQEVTPVLHAAGHRVCCPTLTGLGERVHLARPDTDLETHVTDVVNVLRYDDLSEVILVGHSYGGMVIRGVVDRVPERITQLVYLDALVPEDGDSVFTMMPSPLVAFFQGLAASGWLITPADADAVPPELATWERGRAAPQPLATLTQPLRLNGPVARHIQQHFIHCTDKADWAETGDPFARYAEHARGDPAWHLWTLPSRHDVAGWMPRELAELLLGLG